MVCPFQYLDNYFYIDPATRGASRLGWPAGGPQSHSGAMLGGDDSLRNKYGIPLWDAVGQISIRWSGFNTGFNVYLKCSESGPLGSVQLSLVDGIPGSYTLQDKAP